MFTKFMLVIALASINNSIAATRYDTREQYIYSLQISLALANMLTQEEYCSIINLSDVSWSQFVNNRKAHLKSNIVVLHSEEWSSYISALAKRNNYILPESWKKVRSIEIDYGMDGAAVQLAISREYGESTAVATQGYKIIRHSGAYYISNGDIPKYALPARLYESIDNAHLTVKRTAAFTFVCIHSDVPAQCYIHQYSNSTNRLETSYSVFAFLGSQKFRGQFHQDLQLAVIDNRLIVYGLSYNCFYIDEFDIIKKRVQSRISSFIK